MNRKKNKFWIGFDLGATKMLAAVFDDQFNIRGSKKRKTKGMEGADTGEERIRRTLLDALKDAGIDPVDVSGVGIGSPGPLNLKTGVFPETANLGWKGIDLKAVVGKELKCPVVVLNDVDAGVYGEYRFGAARKAHCVVGVFPGTGLGAGCVYEGRVLRGKLMSCFELGHCRVVPDGLICGCGQKGCLETVASRLAISSQALAAAYRGEAPHLLEERGLDLADIRSKALASSVKHGDKAVEEIIENAARWLGVGVGMMVSLLAPDIIVLGGGLVEAMPDLYLEEVSASARKNTVSSLADVFKVVVSSLGDDATVTGSAAWAKKEIIAGVK